MRVAIHPSGKDDHAGRVNCANLSSGALLDDAASKSQSELKAEREKYQALREEQIAAKCTIEAQEKELELELELEEA